MPRLGDGGTGGNVALGVSNEELTFRRKHGDHRRETIVVTDVPEDFANELKKEEAAV